MDIAAPGSDLTAKARIRNSALMLFSQNGANATSMRSIADAAGVTVGLITHHFGTKTGLVEAVETEISRGIRKAIALQDLDSPHDPAGRRDVVRTLNQRLKDWCQDHPQEINYLRQTMFASNSEVSETLYRQITALTVEQVIAMRQLGYASSRRSVEEQVMQVLYNQLGQIFMQPFIDRVAEVLEVDIEELELRMRVESMRRMEN